MTRSPGLISVAIVAASLAFDGTTGGASAASPPSVQGKRMVQAFKDWAARWSVPDGSVAVMTGSKLVGSGAVGAYKEKKIEPVASLSKAITAMCISQFVASGQLSFNTSLGTLLKSYFHKHPPADPRAKTITLGQLLTHSSGITYDPSQGNQGGLVMQLPHNKTNLEKQAEITFAENLGADPGTSYTYNNMNYSLLGLVIETKTRQAYESYCGDAVLKPVGVTDAKLNPKWRVLASFGGWEISAVDYVRFLSYYLPSLDLLGIDPADWPKFDLGGGAYYSLGTLMRSAGSGYNFWHSGDFSWSDPPDSFGSYFGVLQENVRYEVEFAPTVSDDAFADLDASMYNAAVGAKPVDSLAGRRTDLLPR